MMLSNRSHRSTASTFVKRLKKITAAICMALTAMKGPFPARFGGGKPCLGLR
jgi:hypothetical protein